MGKKRNLNQDYYKLDGKVMRRIPPSQEAFNAFRILEVKLKEKL